MPLNCPVCLSESILERSTAALDLWRCPECDHCFTDISTIREFEEYSPEYLEKTHRNWFRNPNFALFEQVNLFIGENGRDASLIDVGCGNGAFLRYMQGKNAGISLAGIDLTKNENTGGIHFIQGDILTTEFDRQYDYVVSFAVIEHFADVRRFLKRLVALCAARGFIIIMTLNDRSILYGMARFLHNIGLETPHERLYSRHHLNHFNISSLRRLVEIHNLNVIKTLRHNVPLAAVDLPTSAPFVRPVFLAGVWGTFLLGNITGGTYLQTIVCQKGEG